MILRCLSSISRFTTKDKCYKVIKETEHFYIIIDDDENIITNIPKCFIGKFFEVVK